MKILSQQELAQIPLKMTRSSRRSYILSDTLRSLTVGQSLFLAKSEWSYKSTPSILVGGIFRKERTDLKFTTHATTDDRGWVITRIK